MGNMKLLLIDDDASLLEALRLNFKNKGFSVHTATTAEGALTKFSRSPESFAVSVVDYHLPDASGNELIAKFRAINPEANLIVLSGDGSADALNRSLDAGAVYYCEKDGIEGLEKLNVAVKNFCRKYEITQQVVSRSDESSDFERAIKCVGLEGKSAALADVAAQVTRYASSTSNVLIRGETGTGKEVVAKALHRLSGRREKPFVAINCAAIPRDLIESELFGHVRGAFSGAIRDRKGKFQQANGGTLFLDEIGDMPLELQVKLLRVLQERMVEPVGASAAVKIDVRVICATHVDLASAVSAGRFREDLYYRLNVLKIDIPALRERSDDVEALVLHFAEEIGRREGHHIRFLAQTMAYLRNYRWPGNVRELYNIVERLVVSTKGVTGKIEPKHLPEQFFDIAKSDAAIDFSTMTYDDFKKYQSRQELVFLKDHVSSAKSLREAARLRLKMSHSSLVTRFQKIEGHLQSQNG